MKLIVENLRCNFNKKDILKGISFKVPRGKFVGIIGPNGSGKSSILKSVYGSICGYGGRIYLDDTDLKSITPRERARKIGVLPQEEPTQFDFSIEEVVQMGRYPYRGFFEKYSVEDQRIVEESLSKVGLLDKRKRIFNELSGGEKQRVLIGRALAQKSDLLILDEPTNHLDIGYQLEIMNFIKSQNITVLSAIHDINIAVMYCDEIIVVKDGLVLEAGPVEKVVTREMLKRVFNVNGHISRNPLSKKLQVSYVGE